MDMCSSFLHLKKIDGVCVREGERERWWDCSFYSSVPLKNKRSVYCVKVSVCLETVSMETKVSFLYIFTGAQQLRVCVISCQTSDLPAMKWIVCALTNIN